MTRLKKQQVEFASKMSKLVDQIIDIRPNIVSNVFKNKGDKVVSSPVAFHYIINTIQGQCGITSSSLVDITPLEAYNIIQ